MGIRFFTDKHRPVHMGGFPLERLARVDALPDLNGVPAFSPLEFRRHESPKSIVNAMSEYQAVNRRSNLTPYRRPILTPLSDES